MDQTMLPKFVIENDLKSEKDQVVSRQEMGFAISSFISSVISNQNIKDDAFTAKFMAPLIAGMEMEGSYNMKPACYD